MKKIICLLLTLFLFSGCMKVIENATGINLSKHTNPVMEIEMDLVFLDELAAITKLNQIILDRMPISLEDPWPVLLNDYSQTPPETEEAARKKYDACLTRLLSDDFFFYKTYKVGVYINLLTSGRGGIQALLAGGIIAARDLLIIEGAKEMGRRYEHAKWVISYYPLGCKCRFYSRRFESLQPGSRVCRQLRKRRDCPFFSKPTEEMLYQYLFNQGGLETWEELEIKPECLRVVEGMALGERSGNESSFRKVFYTLFPDHIRDKTRKVDFDLEFAQSDLKFTQEKLKEDGLPKGERLAAEKQEEILEERVDELMALQDKLYDQAIETVEPTLERIRAAKQLLQIAKFIDDGFGQITAAMVALTVKMVDDAIAISHFNRTQLENSIAYLVTQGIISGSNAKKRVALLGKRLVTLPVNYAAIVGYATAQKFQVSKYTDYLEVVVAMEDKLKKS
ncbi:MAG: hypothetical protein JRD04_00890 [Deltaproteobacteria bacterium]|nr:hypothetical protein [Deltaproteobacteria bacterium]